MHYQPKLSHAIFNTLLSILFAYLWSLTSDRTAKVMLFASIAFLIITAAIMLSLIEGAHYYSVTAYIEALVKMDTDLRNALAFNVPALNLIVTRGQIQTTFAGTKATREHIHLFLQDSTEYHTASKRAWCTADRPRWAWEEIYNYLLKYKMVGTYAVGNESYAWNGKAYMNMARYFLDQPVADLGSPMVYASDTEEMKID